MIFAWLLAATILGVTAWIYLNVRVKQTARQVALDEEVLVHEIEPGHEASQDSADDRTDNARRTTRQRLGRNESQRNLLALVVAGCVLGLGFIAQAETAKKQSEMNYESGWDVGWKMGCEQLFKISPTEELYYDGEYYSRAG